MIFTEFVLINDIYYQKTYSDKFTIERDGVEYSEAVDPLGVTRIYTETQNPLQTEEQEEEKADN
jgi:hypothetical protein